MTLVSVAHGTRTAAGNEVARELTAAAGAALGWRSRTSFVELCDPLFSDVLATEGGPLVVVPLLLSTGVHVSADLPSALAASGRRDVALGAELGPHPLLAQAQADRLLTAGAEPGRPVVLVAAGSSDPAALAQIEGAARLLGQAWGAPARWATLSGLGPRPEQVIEAGDVVSPYLLATGHFHSRVQAAASSAGAALTAPVIGAHPRLVDLVVDRARALQRTEMISA